MPLDARFHAIAARVFDAGMGTEHVAPLLYHVACMRRPQNVLAVGLGYSTLFLLQALADIDRERTCDERVRADVTRDPARASVLARTGEPPGAARMLVGIDDFSDSHGRLELLADCIDELGLRRHFRLQRCRYQDASPPGAPYQLAWIDCGHQTEYAALSNRFWPLVDGDGGIYAVHYTYVDIVARDPQTQRSDQVMIPGPWVNAAKREIAKRELVAGAELLSLVEPHKARQGSLTLLRKLEPADRCREGDLQAECSALYGVPGEAMMLADDDAEDAE